MFVLWNGNNNCAYNYWASFHQTCICVCVYVQHNTTAKGKAKNCDRTGRHTEFNAGVSKAGVCPNLG